MSELFDRSNNSPHYIDWLELQKLKRENEELKMALNPNNTKQAVEYLRQLRKIGYAVVAFTPEELRGANPDHVEDRLIEMGWEVIDSIAQDIETERLASPSDEDWNWAIK